MFRGLVAFNRVFQSSAQACLKRSQQANVDCRIKLTLNYSQLKNLRMKSIEKTIHQKLTETFEPKHLEIINESYMHNVPPDAETHFKVVIVSDKFENLTLIKKHRWVNETLQVELKSGVHALSIVAKTPSEWESSTQKVEKSPACRGGFGK